MNTSYFLCADTSYNRSDYNCLIIIKGDKLKEIYK